MKVKNFIQKIVQQNIRCTITFITIREHTVDYLYKTEPYAHQHKVFLESRDKPYFAYLMEQGTGKTKVAIDVASWLYSRGEITCMIVIAPKVVHQNWADNEVPIHIPDWTNPKVLCWNGSTTKAWESRWDSLVDHGGLKVYCVNYDSILSDRSEQRVLKLLNQFSTLLILDESTRIKNHKSQRSKKIAKYSDLAPYRRILTGTPVTQSPFDLWSQFRFLSKSILPFKTYADFTSNFAVFDSHTATRSVNGRNVEYRYETIRAYRRLDELSEIISKHSYRVLKSECLDIPDKVYQKIYVEMEGDQKKLYTRLRDNAMVQLETGLVSAAMKLTLLGKLHQILGGAVKDDAGVTQYTEPNAKIQALKSILEDTLTPTIIWTVYQADQVVVCRLLEELGISYRVLSKLEDANAFQNKEYQVLVSNMQVGSVGITLTEAHQVIYFSNSYSYESRIQSEDRVHRSGLKRSVNYIDILIKGTIDEKIIKALRQKRNFSDVIMKDSIQDWL